MSDLKAQLQQAAERHAPTDTPEFADLVARAKRRQTTVRSTGALAACGLAVAAGAVVWTVVAGSDESTKDPTGEPGAAYFAVPTGTWDDSKAGYQALLTGTLMFTAEDCPYLKGKNETRKRWVNFPTGSRGIELDGKRSVVDADNRVYGTEGQYVEFDGGYVPGEPIANLCTPEQTGTFSVQMEPRGTQLPKESP